MKRILTRSPEEYRKAFELFALSGKKIGIFGDSIDSFIRTYPYVNGDMVGISKKGTRITAWSYPHGDRITFDDTEEIKKLVSELLEIGLPKKTPKNDKIYQKMVEDHKDLERQISALKNQQYNLWKDILLYENENFGANNAI